MTFSALTLSTRRLSATSFCIGLRIDLVNQMASQNFTIPSSASVLIVSANGDTSAPSVSSQVSSVAARVDTVNFSSTLKKIPPYMSQHIPPEMELNDFL
jgi:hypothetical protein